MPKKALSHIQKICAWSTANQRRGRTRKIARANLSGDCRSEGLEGTHPLAIRLCTAQADSAKGAAKALAKTENLDKPQP